MLTSEGMGSAKREQIHPRQQLCLQQGLFQKWRRKARSWHQKADEHTAVQRPSEDMQLGWGYPGRIFAVFHLDFLHDFLPKCVVTFPLKSGFEGRFYHQSYAPPCFMASLQYPSGTPPGENNIFVPAEETQWKEQTALKKKSLVGF